ncbi:MAG TPA: GvpL/GvpF family gas vesicle protein [Candidatus Angelobacter sp.]|nr:GvpL/GvpF family gas vesicle protein [Candidatus Angelobacter sp.]
MSPSKKAAKKTPVVRKAASKSEPVAAVLERGPRPVPAKAEPVSSSQQEGLYVYGVIESRAGVNFGKSSIGGVSEDVSTVHYGDIAAVVSSTPVFIYDPTRDNALAHEHVIETVMKNYTIVPMAFGTVFRTSEDIKEVLKSIYPSLKDVLRQMTGKLEFGLKVTWDRDRIIEELKREHDEIHRFHQELTRKHLQSTYFARMQLGRMIDKALAELAANYVRDIYDGLRGVCVASRDNKPIGDKMIMNAAFLIQKEREAEFDAAVNRIAQKFGDRLNFKYTGPWPPYNFVNIRLKLERGTAG